MSLDYMVLKPMLDDLERRVIAGAKETDRWGAEVGAALRSLVSRVAELEKRLSDTFPITFLACMKCGHTTQFKPTGNALLTDPPMTEIACVICGSKRGVR